MFWSKSIMLLNEGCCELNVHACLNCRSDLSPPLSLPPSHPVYLNLSDLPQSLSHLLLLETDVNPFPWCHGQHYRYIDVEFMNYLNRTFIKHIYNTSCSHLLKIRKSSEKQNISYFQSDRRNKALHTPLLNSFYYKSHICLA